jgi:hypothetical protein
MVWCALRGDRAGEGMKWGCGSDWWGRERLIGVEFSDQGDRGKMCYELVERMYKEWRFRLGDGKGEPN